MNEINGVPFRQELLKRFDNRPNESMTPKWLTIHETGNFDDGATAEMTKRWVHNGSPNANGPQQLSFHVVVDDKEAIQLLRWKEQGWHAGDGAGPGNTRSIGMEVCVNHTGALRVKAWDNAARVAAWLVEKFDLELVQHNHWSGKNCPWDMRTKQYPLSWQEFLVQVEGYREGTPPPKEQNMDELEQRVAALEERVARINEVFVEYRFPTMIDGLTLMEEAIEAMKDAWDVTKTERGK